MTLPGRQIVGSIDAERGGAPFVHAVIRAIQEVAVVENRQIRVRAIAAQRIGGERRVVDVVRKRVSICCGGRIQCCCDAHETSFRQPLTDPATRPETIHFWQKMKNTNTGSSASTVMVMKLGQSVENWPTAL